MTVERPGGVPRDIHVTVGHGGSFGSSPLRQEIGLGDAQTIKSVEIRWPGDSTSQRLEPLAVDHAYHVRQGQTPTLVVRQSFDLSP